MIHYDSTHKTSNTMKKKEMADRADGASVTAHGSVRRGLPQVYWGTDGTEQFHVLPYTSSGTL